MGPLEWAGVIKAGTDILGGLFGGGGGNQNTDTKRTSSLELSDEATHKILTDLLGATGGFKDIRGSDKVAGGYNSTSAGLLTGNFMASVLGEIAKLKATKVENESVRTVGKSGAGTVFDKVGDTLESGWDSVQNAWDKLW